MSFLYGYFLWFLIPIFTYLYRREKRQSLQQNLRWVGFVLLLIAISRPVWLQAPMEEKLPAHSIIVALDLSASMNANDIEPSRAIASRKIIKLFLEENKYDQIALIGFTINPLLLSPSTTDHKLLALALESIRSDYILTKGTDLKKLLEKVAAFPDHEKKLLLFSDGGDEPIDEGLVEFAESSNIKILTIAMATQRGSTIMDKDGKALNDKAGHLVVSKFNSSLLALGTVLPFEGVENSAHKIQAWIDQQKVLRDGLKKKSHKQLELFFIPTIFVLILLFLSATRFSLKVITLLALLNINVQADELIKKESWGKSYYKSGHFTSSKNSGWLDGYHLNQAYKSYENQEYNGTLEVLSKIETPTLESELTLAHTYYKLEKYKLAKNILKNIKTTKLKVKQQLFYELGNCEAKLAYYDKAKNYYIQALQLGEDEDVLHNLEWVIFQKKVDQSKVGFTNPNSPEASKEATDNVETEEKSASKKEEKTGSSGGGGAKKSKTSTIKVVKASKKSTSKHEMSSKAYDLINEGYIREGRPW